MILFSNGCPKCRILKMELDKAGVEYTISEDFTKLTELGIMSLPAIELDTGKMIEFTNALNMIRGK